MSASRDQKPWLAAWLGERVVASLAVFAPLALAVALASGTRELGPRTALAFASLCSFRLWDDLEDIEHDRRFHPQRTLCRLSSLWAPRSAACSALALSSALIVAWSASLLPAAPLAASVAWLALVYRAKRRHGQAALRPIFGHAVLLKIPALSLAVSWGGAPAWAAIGRALLLYGTSCLYEIAHDKDVRRSPLAPFLALFDAAAIALGCLICAKP